MDNSISIRLAVEADLPAIDAVYNQAIRRRFCTADLAPMGMERRVEWFRQHSPTHYPIYVYVDSGRVIGWVSLSAYRPGRLALKDTAEISYYVDECYQGKGVGSRLVAHALAEAARLGKRVLLAMIVEGNASSLALLKKFGFEQWGYLPQVYLAEGETRGHVYMGKILG